MGKKACLKLDFTYDDDLYHDDNDGYNFSEDEYPSEVSEKYCLGDDAGHGTELNTTPSHAENVRGTTSVADIGADAKVTGGSTSKSKRKQKSFDKTALLKVATITQPLPFSIAAKSNSLPQMLCYVPNPQRQPLFTNHIANQDGLLYYATSFLQLSEVLILSQVCKVLEKSLAVDGLYCSNFVCKEDFNRNEQRSSGILLPCLYEHAERLLPLTSLNTSAVAQLIQQSTHQVSLQKNLPRPHGLSRTFAYETVAFSKSGSSFLCPRTVLSTKTSEQVGAISCRLVRWEQSSSNYSKYPIQSASPSAASRVTGIRLSFVTTDASNSAVVSVWSNTQNSNTTYGANFIKSNKNLLNKDRFVIPNTHKIIEASFSSELGLCAVLSTSLLGSSRYTLSLVVLPTQPPTARTFQSNEKSTISTQDQDEKPHQHHLKWQKHLPSSQWQLFSSSSTHGVVSFGNQGTYVIFGSTEQWGVVDTETGCRLWNLFNGGFGECTVNGGRLARSSNRIHLTTPMDAFLLHHEFLFLLQNNGTTLRIYDISGNTASHNEPLAEGNLPWSPVAAPRSTFDSLPDTFPRPRQEQHGDNFKLSFCSGKIWITGTFKRDLLCSSPPRLLRRLRSHIRGSPIPLRFVRMKIKLNSSKPNSMHPWNDTHLYFVDLNNIYSWRSNSSDGNKNGGGSISTVFSARQFIKHLHVDGTKIVVCTGSLVWNVQRLVWDRKECMVVVPINIRGKVNEEQQQLRLNKWLPYPPMEVYHTKIFPYPTVISPGTNGYNVMEMSCDGRYVLLHCFRSDNSGSAGTTSVVLDLYTSSKG